MFIGFADLNKHFEHVMLIVHVYWICHFGWTLWTILKNPENIGSGKWIYSGKFICGLTKVYINLLMITLKCVYTNCIHHLASTVQQTMSILLEVYIFMMTTSNVLA